MMGEDQIQPKFMHIKWYEQTAENRLYMPFCLQRIKQQKEKGRGTKVSVNIKALPYKLFIIYCKFTLIVTAHSINLINHK